jgi:hypothetical protein
VPNCTRQKNARGITKEKAEAAQLCYHEPPDRGNLLTLNASRATGCKCAHLVKGDHCGVAGTSRQ